MKRTTETYRFLVVIPSYNDFELVNKLIEDIQALSNNFQVLLIKDGSTVRFDDGKLGGQELYVRLPSKFGLAVCRTLGSSIEYGFVAGGFGIGLS